PYRQAQRRRSAGLARRRAGPHRRSQDHRLGCALALELAARHPCGSRCLTQLVIPAVLNGWIPAILIPIFTAVAARFIWERPETANVVLKFLLDLTEQAWVRFAASALGGFVVGLWLDWLLRKVDDSRTDKRKALGTEMLNLADNLRTMHYPMSK